MIHTRRRFQITTCASQEELIEQLTQHSWTLCMGFRFNGFLWLNDAFSEDGAQEYAVILEHAHRQVESITVSWCTVEALQRHEKHLHTYIEGKPWLEGFPMWVPVQPVIEPVGQHARCRLCA